MPGSALQMVDLLWGTGDTSLGLSPIPSLQGWGWVLLAVASLVSIQVGRGRLWPGVPGAELSDDCSCWRSTWRPSPACR